MTKRTGRRIDLLPWWIELPLRYVRGKTIKYGERHDGHWTDAQVVAMRLGPPAWLATWIYLLIAHPLLAWAFKWWTIVMFGVLPLLWLFKRVANWWMFRGDLKTLGPQLHELLGWDAEVKPYHWLHFPLNWRSDRGSKFRIDLQPKSLQKDPDKELAVSIISEALNLHIDLDDVTIKKNDKKPHAVVRIPIPPPSKAMWADHVETISKYTKTSQLVTGIGQDKEPVVIDLDDDAPMGLICSDPGGGKSTLFGSWAAQLLHKGAIVVCIDPKRMSQQGLKGLPNVAYFGGPAESAEGLIRLHRELDFRTTSDAALPPGQAPPKRRRVVALLEEADALERDLRDHAFLTTGTRNNPESITAMVALRAMGRQPQMNQLVVSQSGAARALGGGDARSMFGFILVRGNRSVWKKVAEHIEKPPAASRHKGRFHLLIHGSKREVQTFGFASPDMDEAREYAMSGDVAEMPHLLKRGTPIPPRLAEPIDTESADSSNGRIPAYATVTHPGPMTQNGATVTQGSHLRLVAQDLEPGPMLVTLAEAVDQGILTLKLNAARTASGRKGFPAERGRRPIPFGADPKLYDRAELAAWNQSRLARLG